MPVRFQTKSARENMRGSNANFCPREQDKHCQSYFQQSMDAVTIRKGTSYSTLVYGSKKINPNDYLPDRHRLVERSTQRAQEKHNKREVRIE